VSFHTTIVNDFVANGTPFVSHEVCKPLVGVIDATFQRGYGE
jgi:hypothetical protein